MINVDYRDVTRLTLTVGQLPDNIQAELVKFLMDGGYADDDQEIEFKNFMIEADIYDFDIPLDELAYGSIH